MSFREKRGISGGVPAGPREIPRFLGMTYLSSEVGQLSSAVGYLSSEVGQLSSEVGYLSSEVGQLSSEVGYLSSEVGNDG
ncbi:MAG: hypothetical protein ACPGWR_26545 [Ardenticatenaceae bacterium]